MYIDITEALIIQEWVQEKCLEYNRIDNKDILDSLLEDESILYKKILDYISSQTK